MVDALLSQPAAKDWTMQRSRFPSSGERDSLLRPLTLGRVGQPSSRRYKSGPTAIEFAFGATLICILMVSVFHAIGIFR
jgi:hypothetical protein